MLKRAYEVWKHFDSAYNASQWIWWGFQVVTGLTAGSIMGLLFSQLDWFWAQFRWGGVFGVAILTWVAVGYGLNQWASWSQRKISFGAPVLTAAKRPAVLSPDQREFRLKLKLFSLHCVPEMLNDLGRAFSELKTKEKELAKGSAGSVALHFFIHHAASSNLNQSKIMEMGSADIDAVDVEAIQFEIVQFLRGYAQRQHGLAHLNAIVDTNLSEMASMRRWLATDAKCAGKFAELTVWPESHKKLGSAREYFGSMDEKWKQPTKVNY